MKIKELSALAISLGYEGVAVDRAYSDASGARFEAWVWGADVWHARMAVTCYAPTKRAALAGLAAALKALPARKAKRS